MKISDSRRKELAREGKLRDEKGDKVKPFVLKDKPPPEPVDKQLQTLQRAMDAMLKLAEQGESNRKVITEAMAKMAATVQGIQPSVEVEAVMPGDAWQEAESEVTEWANGRIKRIVHRRIA